MRKIICMIFILSLITISLSYSQETDGAKIIENLYMASTLGKIQDMIVDTDIFGPTTGNKESKNAMELVATVRVFFSSPSNIRTEKTIFVPGAQSDMYIVTIRDGLLAWQYTPYESKAVTKTKDDNHHSQFLPFNIDTQPQDKFRNYTLIGEEKLGERDCYLISVTNTQDPSSSIINVWIDKEYFVPLKEEKTVVSGESEVKQTVKYEQIQQLPDGRWMPFQIFKYENDKVSLYMNFNNVVINQGLPASLFTPEMQ